MILIFKVCHRIYIHDSKFINEFTYKKIMDDPYFSKFIIEFMYKKIMNDPYFSKCSIGFRYKKIMDDPYFPSQRWPCSQIRCCPWNA